MIKETECCDADNCFEKPSCKFEKKMYCSNHFYKIDLKKVREFQDKCIHEFDIDKYNLSKYDCDCGREISDAVSSISWKCDICEISIWVDSEDVFDKMHEIIFKQMLSKKINEKVITNQQIEEIKKNIKYIIDKIWEINIDEIDNQYFIKIGKYVIDILQNH